jgi:outer membrane protein assembly factor BamB
MILRLVFAFALIGLTGCGLQEYVVDYIEGEENTEPPAELVEFQSLLDINELWSEDIGSGTEKQFLKLQPIADGDAVYGVDRGGDVYAFQAQSGNAIWEQDLETRISGGLGIGESLVLVGTSDGEVIALAQGDGSIAWRSSVSSEVLAAPKAAEGVVVARTIDGKIIGLDATNGHRLWVYDRQVPVLTLRGTSAPVLVNGLAIAGLDSGNLVALELRTGKIAWEANIAPPRGRSDLDRMVDIDAEPVVDRDTLYVAAYHRGVIAVSLEQGKVLWNRDLSSHSGIALDSDNIYLSDDDGTVWAIDRISGSANWKQDKLHARALTAPAIVDDYLVVGDFEGYLHWLSRDDGHFVARVQVDSSRLIATPVVTGSILYAYSAGGTLSAFQPTGALREPAPEPVAEETDDATDGEDQRDGTDVQDEEASETKDESEGPKEETAEESPGEESRYEAPAASEDPPARSHPDVKPSMRNPDWLFP